jgi:hypothetical protein
MKTASLAFLTLWLAVSAFGQTGLATITGTVSDPTGAVVANAPIEVRNLATGLVLSAVSTETGNFTVSQVPIGEYDLVVTVPGFKTYSRQGFRLAAQQIMREDVRLEIGTAAEAVTVTADASLLKTESSELVHNVTVSQLNNLPILSVGGAGQASVIGFRDPFALVQMIPGIQYVTNSTMVVNGNPDDTVQFRVDGQTSGNTGGMRALTPQTQQSVDAIQEVAVQTSNYAAEFGTAGGAVINMVMKSGTNRYSGSVYDYAVNEVLNAHQPYTGVRTAQKRHDWGFTGGGPVRIPKYYDGTNRTFFFFSYEQFREDLLFATSQPTVPIPEYRAGNFAPLIAAENNRPLRTGTGASATNYVDPLGRPVLSGMIFDPNTTRPAPSGSGTVRDQFPGNLIPANRFDPVAQRILALVPLPKGGNSERGQFGNNYQNPWIGDRRSHLPSLKMDQTIGSKGRLSGYWQENITVGRYSAPLGEMEGFPLPITLARGSYISSKTYRLNYDHTLTPTMLLHLGAGWNSVDFSDRSPVTNYNAEKELGLRGAILHRQFPRINVGTSGAALGGMSPLGVGAQSRTFERRPAGNASLSWVKNNHTYKFGAEYRLEKYPLYSLTNVAGNYSFGNSTLQTSLQGLNVSQGFHGFNFASFMMGDLSSATLAQPTAQATAKSQWALYAQDTWKLTRRLTLDYGLRWDYGTYAKEMYGRNGNFSLDVPNPSAGGHPGGTIFEATCRCTFASNYPYAIGPRVGVAYQINDRTVLRTGFGIVYSATGTAGGTTVNSATTGAPGFGLTVGRLQDGMPASVQPKWPNFDVNLGQSPGAVVAAPVFLDPNAGRPAKQYQWSFGLQREITRNLVVEASYVANRGVWWSEGGAGGLAAINVLKLEDLISRGFTDFTSAAESALLTTPIGNLNTAQRSTLAARGIGLPYSNFPTTLTARQAILPFPQYNTSISPSQAPLGKTWYDSLQINVTQRFDHGLSFNANYTFSKNLDLMSSPDIFNRQLGKNLTNLDRPHQFRMTAEYQVPSLANRGIKVLSNPVVAYILGNWGVGWYLQYQSAPVLTRPSNQGTIPISNFLGRGPGPAQLKTGPDGKPMNPWSVNWVDYSGKQRTDPIDINCHCFDPTKNIVLNPAAWESIPNGQWAANFSDIRYYRGIRYPQENFNVSRNFRFGERVLVHIRAEFQNVLNRMRLPQPSAGGNFSAAPTRFTTGANAGLYSGGFGTIVPVSGTTGARTGTLIGRITF